jgi:hypothetical protein
MSDQTPPTPEPDPAATTPVEGVAEVPAGVEPAPEAAAPAQWPAEGYPPPPVYPPATYPAQDAAPAAYPAVAPPPYPPAAYPPPAYQAAPAGPQTSSNAILALILAITSWAVCPVITAVVALVLASNAAKEIEASGGRVQGAGLVTAARVVSWVNIGLWAAILVIGAFFLVLIAVAGGTNEMNF